MSKLLFFTGYFLLGVTAMVVLAFVDVFGLLLPSFGTRGDIDTSSRQGYWYTYRRSERSSAVGGRTPSGGGSYSGGGGWSGGK